MQLYKSFKKQEISNPPLFWQICTGGFWFSPQSEIPAQWNEIKKSEDGDHTLSKTLTLSQTPQKSTVTHHLLTGQQTGMYVYTCMIMFTNNDYYVWRLCLQIRMRIPYKGKRLQYVFVIVIIWLYLNYPLTLMQTEMKQVS